MQRRIHFFEARLVHYDRQGGETVSVPSDIPAVFRFVSQLTWDENAEPSAYEPAGDGYDAVRVARFIEDGVLGQLARSRRRGLPPLEYHGSVRPLVLPANHGLYEAAHFGLFWDRSIPILAMEFNLHAPRHPTLAAYLKTKLHDSPVEFDDATFTPLIKGDILDQIERAGAIGKIDLAVRRDAISEIRAADKRLGTALTVQASYAPEMATVGVSFSREKYSKSGGGGQDLKRAVLRLIRRRPSAFVRAKMAVEQNVGSRAHLHMYDLLRDQWVHEVTVPYQRDNTINSRRMLDNIRQLYVANREDLAPPREESSGLAT